MSLSLVTAPATEPVSRTEAKLHLRVTTTDDDTLIDNLITAARSAAEQYTQRAFITQTWDAKFDQFPDDVIILPKPPAVSITSVKYIDTNGTQQTWASSNYRTSIPTGLHAEPARIERAWGVAWPSIREVVDAVEVRFVAGYGAASAVPMELKQAMLLLIGHWYANRESVVTGTITVQVPQTVQWILDPYYAGRFQ